MVGPVPTLILGHLLQVALDGRRSPLPITHREDDGRGATHDVATRKDARQAGHAVRIDHEIAPLVDDEARLAGRQQRVGAGADGDHDHLARDLELRSGHRLGPSPARRVWFAERHAHAAHRPHPACLVAQHLHGRDLQLEADAFLLGVVDLLAPGRQLLVTAPVRDDRLIGTETSCGAHGIHRDIAATHDDDPMPVQHGRVRILAECTHQVDPSEVLVGRVDALEVLARDVHEHRQAGADRQEDGVVHGPQLAQRPAPADDGVDLDLHP